LKYSKNKEGKLVAIRYPVDILNTLTVTKVDEKWRASVHTKKLEVRLASARGTINSSLFLAGKKAGLTDAMIMELAGIFGWDIDFILDIREGDQFVVIYEEKYVKGDKIGNGNILAAEFINQGKSFQSVRYTDNSGRVEYYTPAGVSMRKAFLRAPVDFSYISSKFNPRRFHPILKRVKAHNGVDYRTPTGTPVKAAGDGKVIVSAYSKYNGHHVFVQHGQKYVTKYLHFSKRKVRRGQKVKQGQIIGYVGATGLAQAPHLHYEFLVNGVHRNPRTIKLPDAEPINKNEKNRFLNKTRELVKQLEVQTQVYDDKLVTAD
jgi:murein DD-endopeptidase MepM/ murein hydrolase activator NlpD